MILVTGAAGKTGRSVVRALARKGSRIAAMVHRPEQLQALKALGAAEVIVGDMRSRSTMAAAMRGVQAVYHICPNMSRDELAMSNTALLAARSSGVEHFVYHSVLHPQVEAMPHHWQKMRVEESIFESGLAFTILQPAAYMQNVVAYWDQVMADGVYAVPYAVGTRLNLVDLDDVAEVASTVLTEKGHSWATYELAGPAQLSAADIASKLGNCLGRPIQAQSVSRDAWSRKAVESGLARWQVDMLVAMFEYYERGEFLGNPRVLGCVLGRPPTTFDEYLRKEAGQRIGRN